MMRPLGWIKRRARRLMRFYGLTSRRVAVMEAAGDYRRFVGMPLILVQGGR